MRELHLWSNNFYGSLEPLKNLTKLRKLDIDNTSIDSGLEYLPMKLEIIYCRNCKELESELKGFDRKEEKGDGSSVIYYDLKHWKENQPYFKWLKREIRKLNPNLNVYDALGNIFFNVKTGEFVGNLQTMTTLLNINKEIIEEKEKQINLFELQIQELTNLIKQRKEKIVNSYLSFASENERELLKELVTLQLEYTKFKKQETNYSNYREEHRKYNKKYLEIKTILEDKLGEEQIEEIERILTDCEVLKLELEEKFNAKSLFLTEQKQLPQINITENIINASQDHLMVGNLFGENKENWVNIHSSFVPELVQEWNKHNFTYQECKEWIDIGLVPQDYEYAHWLSSIKQLTPEKLLNESNDAGLRELFQEYNNYSQIQTPPK